jgi:inner membrane protein
MFLSPLSDRRFALSTTFIIDLWLGAILLAGIVASLAWRTSRAPAVAALAGVVGYVAFQGWQHREAIEFGARHAQAQGMHGAKVSAIPRPVSSYNWMVVAEDGDRIDYSQVRLTTRPALLGRLGVPFFDRLAAAYLPAPQATWTRVERFGPEATSRAVRQAFEAPELEFFRWFADHPALYRVDRGNPSTCIWFQDLRFVTPGRDVMPFRYGLCENQGRWARFRLDGETRIPVR